MNLSSIESKNQILINYLSNLISDIKNNNLSDENIQIINKLIFLKNCEINEIIDNSNDILNYTFLGWYIVNYEKIFLQKENISN